MSIKISNLTVQHHAPSGTVIGVLTAQDAGTVIPCAYSLTKGSAGLFAIAGNQLVTYGAGQSRLAVTPCI